MPDPATTQPQSDLPVIVLAAGASRRMRGRDKLLEKIAGEPLLRRQARLARAVTRGPVLIALPPRPHARYAALDGLEVTPVPVTDAAEGMGASLRTAFAALPDDASAAMILLADLPELTASDLTRLLSAADCGGDTLAWRGATEQGAPGHPLVVTRALFPAFHALRGDDGGRGILARVQNKVQLIALPGQRARCDLDTPEDWQAWRERSR